MVGPDSLRHGHGTSEGVVSSTTVVEADPLSPVSCEAGASMDRSCSLRCCTFSAMVFG